MTSRNQLLYGDNLAFLADSALLPSESVDLIYLDPPFNSNATYNVLFAAVSGQLSAAQVKAFDDTWTWDTSAASALFQLLSDEHTPNGLKALMNTFHRFLGQSPMLAYLVQMAVRLVHLRRVLKPTGSLYLHCDPTACHYLKLTLDAIFGPACFLNELIWKRTSAHSGAKRYGPIHDVILFYGKTDQYNWIGGFTPYTEEYRETFFEMRDPDGRRWKRTDLTGAGVRHGDSGKPWRGINPTKVKRHWAIPGNVLERNRLKGTTVQKKLDALDAAGFIHWPAKPGGMPRLKQYPEELPGVPLQDVIDDIRPIHNLAAERLGYPTQKPVALLKRFISASSGPGAVILDPFCGCGTTIDAVETLNREHMDQPPRHSIGIDITHLAINPIKSRLTRFEPPPTYAVLGEPVDVAGAEALFRQDPHQFQFWACGLVGARPVAANGTRTAKKGADRGIDGERYFVDDNKGPKTILVQVKGGKTTSAHVRDFRGVLEREQAAIGIFIALHTPTGPMRTEAAGAGMYRSRAGDTAIPRLQIVTIEQLLQNGNPARPNGVQLPRNADVDRTFKKAKSHDEGGLFASERG